MKNVDPESIKNILVIRDGRIGDLLMTTPVIDWISHKYPNAKLDIMIGLYGEFVFENNDKINSIILYDKKSSVVAHIKLILNLRSKKYDLIIVLEQNSHYKILAYLISNKIRIGISGKLNRLLHSNSKWDKLNHTIVKNLNVLKPLFEESDLPSTQMSLILADEDISNAKTFLKEKNVGSNQKIIFIHVACGPNDKLRPWPPMNIAALSDLLIENLNAVVILNSGPGEELIVNKVKSLMKNTPIINTSNINLTSALMKLSHVVIGPDTGTLHIANALKTPIIALFGPTSLEDCGPIGPEERIVVLKKIFECSPCVHLNESENRDQCEKQEMADCMSAISVDEVYTSTLSLLNQPDVV